VLISPYLLLLVLENLTHPFSKPNVIDIKLGTVFYDEDATPEKKERMIKKSRESTSLQTGIRISGFVVGTHSSAFFLLSLSGPGP
jgi:inositol-polyphosphate multikinase